jgi:NADH-quinone oxidoreductase subunit H
MGNFSLFLSILTIAIVMGVVLGGFAYLTLLERKISAWMQDRKGPNRVGPLGLLQPIADGVKFLLKEEVVPKHVDKLFYILGPSIATATALLALAVVPFGKTTVAPDRDWPQTAQQETAASQERDFNAEVANSKFSLFGALRASAQVISYEIPMGMSILGVVLLAGSLNLERIIQYQVDHTWLVFYQPLAAILFITAVFAECNRLPFDLSECEQELVAGYHTEYSGMKFALFMIGEYTHMITTSFLVVILFFGGWQILPFVGDVGGSGVGGVILKLAVLCGKMFLFICFYMLVRWTLPRFRFDQLMGLAWKVLLPLALVNLVAVLLIRQLDWTPWVLLPVSLGLLVGAGWVATLMPKPPLAEPARHRLARMQAEAATR